MRKSIGVVVTTIVVTASCCCSAVAARVPPFRPSAISPAARSLKHSTVPPMIMQAPPLGTVDTDGTPAPSWVPRVKMGADYNWSGYGDHATAQNNLDYVYSRWVVPSYTCATRPIGSNGSQTSQWIGLDGYGSASLEQQGTIEGCMPYKGKLLAYTAMFWEMIPQGPHLYFNLVKPGNVIESSTKYVSVANGKEYFQLVVHDISTGRYLNVTEPCAATTCPFRSSEAIAEWPGKQLGSGLTLTRFGEYPFADFWTNSWNASAKQNQYGYLHSTGDWSLAGFYVVDPRNHNKTVMAPTAVGSDTRSFSERWLATY